MKIRVNEAESDYVKIGNMVLPKNAAGYGYDDYDTIARKTKAKYNQEKEDERKEQERQERIKAGKIFYDKFMEIYNANKDSGLETLMEALFDEFVPASGACDNLGAELIRAIERVRYRSYNDGDRFYEGYGLETCASDAAFIAEHTDDNIYNTIINIADSYDDSDTTYNNRLDKLAKSVVEYIKNTQEIAALPMEDSRKYSSPLISDWEDDSKHYEYEVDIPYEINDFVDRGCIDDGDIYNFLDDLTSYYGGKVYSRWGHTITDLSRDECDEWERMCPKELNSWIDELISEYGEYDEDDEDDEDYDDED